MACCDIFEVFDKKNNLLKDYKHWSVLVRNVNTTLGNCVVISKEHHDGLGESSKEEMAELAVIAKELETAIKKTFNCQRFNWLCLMMKDHHNHFHVLPRYDSPRQFAGGTWTDEGWPKMAGGEKAEISSEILAEIKKALQANLD